MLEHIDEYLQENTSSTIINRGEYIFHKKMWKVEKFDIAKELLKLKILSSDAYTEYKVTIKHFFSEDRIDSRCNCPYEYHYVCKHQVAGFKVLKELLNTYYKEAQAEEQNYVPYEDISTNYSTSYVRRTKISALFNYANTSANITTKAQNLFRQNAVQLVHETNEILQVSVAEGGKDYVVNFEVEKDTIKTQCICSNHAVKLCEHKLAALLELRKQKGDFLFETMGDHTQAKNELLAQYAYSLADDIEDKFEFYFEEGKLKLRLLKEDILPISTPKTWENMGGVLKKNVFLSFSNNAETQAESNTLLEAVFVFETAEKPQTLAKVYALFPKIKNHQWKPEQFAEKNATYLITDDGDDLAIELIIRQLGFQSEAFEENSKTYSPENTLHTYQQLFKHLQDKNCAVAQRNVFRLQKLQPIEMAAESYQIKARLEKNYKLLKLAFWLVIGENEYAIETATFLDIFVVQLFQKLYLPQNAKAVFIVQQLVQQKNLLIAPEQFGTFYRQLLLPLSQVIPIDWNDCISYEVVEKTPTLKVYLHENNDHLVFTPELDYESTSSNLFAQEPAFDDSQTPWIMYQTDEKLLAEYRYLIDALHPHFSEQSHLLSRYISFNEALKNKWIFHAFKTLQEKGIAVFGYEELKKFRFNLNLPEVKTHVSSGIDWFDVHIEIQFGNQTVNVKSLQKAVFNKQNYILLDDGTFGILPEEWLNENVALLKFGEVKKDKLRISKIHFSLIDEKYLTIDEFAIQKELADKKQKLLYFDGIDKQKLPPLNAELRPYQEHAYNWLRFLNGFGWGGCLADDMGLGKTLQALSILQYSILEKPQKLSLVVLPTSLVFNWENEIQKFAPEIKYVVHAGNQRQKTLEAFEGINVIICTYGIVANDIEFLAEIPFEYIILDESQAIKNPNSKRYKAACLLQGKHKLAMTGTPVENNTFDLYAQMNFVNPGFLGSMQFFKEEFANPIDRDGDPVKMQQLKKLTHPFVLRRTKEQVAPELPEKTESIQFCEMGARQKRVYDVYKTKYRELILNKIQEEGLNKAGMYVLEGLMRLRQICDSPALLKESVEYAPDAVKVDMLMEHLDEHLGEHKALVFSQFLGMLDLVRKRLDDKNIEYVYLDGSTQNRSEVVARFQNDDTCRVFLISLRAGGLGLNLTEADYVFLLDPWWNPAVETQAIDRTHRIGQTRNIFAYKFICKDSIEEKVLQLQQKKKYLANELVSNEQNFLKHLTKEDIEDLFG